MSVLRYEFIAVVNGRNIYGVVQAEGRAQARAEVRREWPGASTITVGKGSRMRAPWGWTPISRDDDADVGGTYDDGQ